MRIVLATFGSRGDVQPMLALSLALKSAGHEVLLAAPPEKAQWAKELGCPFRPLGSDVTAFIDGMKDAHSLGSGFRFTCYIHREIATQFDVLPGILLLKRWPNIRLESSFSIWKAIPGDLEVLELRINLGKMNPECERSQSVIGSKK